MKKRIILMMIAVSMFLGAFPVNASAEAATVVEAWNIVLGDNIGANFYVEVPEDAVNAAVKVTVADQTETHALTAPNSKGLHKVSVNVAAVQMTEDITLQLVADGTEYTPVSYSIRDYAVCILTGTYSDKVKDLAKHMLNYGAAAQTHFNIHTDKLANAGYQIDYTAQYPAEYVEAAVSGQISGVQAYGATLVLDNKVSVRYYFAADSVEGVTFSANGVNYTAKQKSGMYYVEIPGIAPQDYADAITLTAQKGDEQLQVTYSPMTYMVRMSQKGAAALKTVINAMYGYYEAAVAYVDHSIFSVVKGDWDLTNQYNGSLTILNGKDGTTVQTNADNYRGVAVTVKDYMPKFDEEGNVAQGDFSAQIVMTFDNGKVYQVRLHNTDSKSPNYKLQTMGANNSLPDGKWAWKADLTSAQKDKLLNGNGVEFAVKLVGSNAELWVDGSRMAVVALGADYDGSLARISLCMNGNQGIQNMVIPFELITPTAPVELTLPTVTGGTVAVDSGYQVGDTIPVTVKPDAGYSQKLYIDGKPLLLGWKTNTYNLVATQETYEITGSFEPSLNAAAKDAKRWDSANQAHGILNAYYPSNDDAWIFDINGEYRSIAVQAKNYLAGEDGNGGEGFAVSVGFKLSNNKEYSFRIIRQSGKYYCQRNNISGDWKKFELSADAIAAVCGEGAELKLTRIGANTLQVTVNGVIMDSYTMADVTEADTVTKAFVGHYGNKGQKVAIPFEIKTPTDAANVQLHIAATEHGAVTAEHAQYQVGDTVKLTVTADSGYSQKLYINGEPLLLDAGSNDYSFVATEEVYDITGSFEPELFTVMGGNWDLSNQNQGVITIVNKTKDGSTVITNANNYKEVAITVKDYTPSRNEDGSLKQGNFSMQVAMIFDDGKYYEVRLHNTDANKPNYKLQNVGNANNLGGSGWTWLADLTAAQKAKLLDGDGVEFAVKLVGPNAELWVDGSRMKVVELGAEYDGKLAQVKLCMNGNKNGQNIVIPFELKVPEEAPTVQFNIPELANGTVAPEYDNYKVGDTVTLTVTPADGYSQKLYINGEPMLVNANGAYSFEATKEVYNITGSFEPSLSVSTNGRWYATNQAHGILNAYYPNNNDAWKMSVNGEYNSLAIMVKNFLPQADTMEGDALGGFSVVIGVKMDNGNIYSFRIINKKIDGAPQYQYSRFGGDGKAGWGGKCVLDDKVPGATDLINGDGIEFKVTRTGDNTLALTLNGVVLDTYTMNGITADNKVSAVLVYHYGNTGENVEVPFTVQ